MSKSLLRLVFRLLFLGCLVLAAIHFTSDQDKTLAAGPLCSDVCYTGWGYPVCFGSSGETGCSGCYVRFDGLSCGCRLYCA